MGYRGKLDAQRQARRLRRTGLPLAEIDRLVEEGRARVGRLSERSSWWRASPCTRGKAPSGTAR
jgi:hypothetical protein